jgi:hypothetical protein
MCPARCASFFSTRLRRTQRNSLTRRDFGISIVLNDMSNQLKGDAVRAIKIIEHISLDGVIQAPGGLLILGITNTVGMVHAKNR